MADTWETEHDLSFAIPPTNRLGSLFEINSVNLDLPKKKTPNIVSSHPSSAKKHPQKSNPCPGSEQQLNKLHGLLTIGFP